MGDDQKLVTTPEYFAIVSKNLHFEKIWYYRYMLIKLKVFPGSRKESIKELSKDRFEICVREGAKEGRANLRILEIFKEKFPNAKYVRIVKGHTSSHKHIDIHIQEK
jgi:uncharacterized protein (TIGR00251 family)